MLKKSNPNVSVLVLVEVNVQPVTELFKVELPLPYFLIIFEIFCVRTFQSLILVVAWRVWYKKNNCYADNNVV